MGFLSFLQSIKILSDIGSFVKNSFNNKQSAFIAILISSLFCFFAWTFVGKIADNQGGHYYNDTLRDNEIYRQITEALQECGDKSSVMIGAINLDQKVGVIKDFYSCDGSTKNCIINTKEKNLVYRKSYVVDDATYAYLQETGQSNQIQSINLETGDISSPISRFRIKLDELQTLNALIQVSEWYNDGDLRILKLVAIVDRFNSVIFTISFTSKNECLVADNLLMNLKQTINQSRNKNAFIFVF